MPAKRNLARLLVAGRVSPKRVCSRTVRGGPRVNSFVLLLFFFGLGIWLPGCDTERSSSANIEKIWGRRGMSDGRFQKPRAMALDSQGRLFIVDMTARIQVFDREGNFIRSWRTPEFANGRPTGLAIDRHGRLAVADTHYFRILFYSPEGELLETLGGTEGSGSGEFNWVTDTVEDSHGNLYVAEYGEFDRIQKFSPDRKFLLEWGGHGTEPGQLSRPQNMLIDKQDQIWVADACNHRIQVFDTEGKVLKVWGESGSEPGKLYFPYDLDFDDQGNLVVCEYGNHRLQKFTPDGKSLGTWGREGRQEGELFNPWALECDTGGVIHVLDSNNNRIQRIVW